jgi:hypothetical protein
MAENALVLFAEMFLPLVAMGLGFAALALL